MATRTTRKTFEGAVVLDEVIARAASPFERATGGWLAPAGAGRVDERLEAWAASAANGRVDELLRLLARRGLTGAALTRALSDAEVAAPGGPEEPLWARATRRLAAVGRRGDAEPPPIRAVDVVEPGDLPAATPAAAAWRFESVCRPWLAAAAEVLDGAAGAWGSGVAQRARSGLIGGLARRWHEILVRPLHEPLTLGARLYSVPAREAATVEAAYLGSAPDADDWLGFWRAYPGAARLMALSFELWRSNVHTLFDRLVRDRADLEAAFARGSSLGPLERARWAGDPHEGHQCVALFAFASGAEIAYKSRPLDPDHWYAGAYRELTGDVYDVCGRIVARDAYGWQGVVAEAPCDGEPAVTAYFRRIGAHARVLELLEAMDAHGENVVADGDAPTMIDIETLLTPRLSEPGQPLSAADLRSESPVATALLTTKARGRPGRPALEIGALAAPGSMTTPWDVAVADPVAGRLAFAPGRFEAASALPRRGGASVLPDAYEDEIVAGYLAADAGIRRDGAAWLRDGRAAEALRPRFVYRETRLYARLLTASVGAAALRDGVARELVLEVLWRVDVRRAAPVPALVQAEIDALRDLDVPLFRSCPATGDLLARGRRVRGCVPRAPLDELGRRVAAAPRVPGAVAADRVRAALFVRDPMVRPSRPGGRPTPEPTDPRAIGRRLLALAIERRDAAPAWVGLRYESAFECWSLGLLGGDLATGTAGIAAVLAELWRQTGDPAAGRVAERLVADAPESLEAFVGDAATPEQDAAAAVYGLHRAARTLGLDAAALESRAEDRAVVARAAGSDSASAWLLGLSGCAVASGSLERLRLDIARDLRSQLDDLPDDRPGGIAGRFADLTPLARAIVALARVSAARSDASLAVPDDRVVACCCSPKGLDSLAAHALLAAGLARPEVRSALERAVRGHRLPADAPPLERAEHALARSWSGCGSGDPRTWLERRRSGARAPERFDLGAFGGLAGACHLALRLAQPNAIPPLRTYPQP
ncbi:MAG: DUF4135 domain-containing protein [Actinomycetota bacterium]